MSLLICHACSPDSLLGHNLNVELLQQLQQQHHNVPCKLRNCIKCNWNGVQDEQVVLLICPSTSVDLAELRVRPHHHVDLFRTLYCGSSRH